MNILFRHVFTDVKVVGAVAMKAADNETLTGAVVDTAGYEGVAFVAVAAEGEALNFSMKAQQDSAVGMGAAADLEGSATAFATTIPAKGVATLDVFQPRERYVRPVVTVPNAAAATIVTVIAILYSGREHPVTNVGKLLASPVEGTA